MREDIIFFSAHTSSAPFEVLMCGTSYCDGGYRIRRHCSELCCIEYVIRGTGEVQIDDTVCYPSGGDVYILPMDKRHDYRSSANDPWEKVWFNVSGRLASQLLKSYGLQNVYHVPDLPIRPLFDEFLETAKRIKQSQPLQPCFDECTVVFLKIVQAIAAHVGAIAPTTEETVAERLKARLDAVSDFSLSFDEMLRDIPFTKSHLIRLFRADFGVTPYEYLLRRKLEYARLLLENTSMSIGEISERLSFSSPHYFSSFFARRVGMSPKEYRNHIR